MSSLVLKLQEEAMNSQAKVTDILRKALVVAVKLDIKEFKEWCQKELQGYGDKDPIPEYRNIRGEIKAFHPYHGWSPVIFTDEPELAEALSRRYVAQPIGELESILETPDGLTHIPFPEETRIRLTQGMNLHLPPTLIVGKTQIFGIVEAVRNTILQWSLKLEQDGILGEGLTFSQGEKKIAASHVYNIQNFIVAKGNVDVGGDIVGRDKTETDQPRRKD